MIARLCSIGFSLLLCAASVFAQPITTDGAVPVIERGTYVNYFNCMNPAYAIFAHSGDDSGSDTRLGLFLLGWDTADIVPTNRGSARYLIRRCQVTMTLNNGGQIIHDNTQDDYRTQLATNDAAYLPDADAGRPIELFGAGFRHGFSAATFEQCSPVGNGATSSNNTFAVSWSTNGTLVDVGNNVGKTLPGYPPFEVWPFAVAQTTNCAPGELMPAAARLAFELNLEDPFVVTYLQHALNEGRIRLMATSLHQVSGQFGAEPYPALSTRFNQALLDPPSTLALEVAVVRDLDMDSDTLPDDWEQFYFSSLTNTAAGDFDNDNATNADEFHAGTDPTLARSIFHITSVIRYESGMAELHWLNLPSRRFEVDYADTFGMWQTVPNPTLWFPTSTTVVWQEAVVPNGARLYRVRAIPE